MSPAQRTARNNSSVTGTVAGTKPSAIACTSVQLQPADVV
jgi:hypothetical protein